MDVWLTEKQIYSSRWHHTSRTNMKCQSGLCSNAEFAAFAFALALALACPVVDAFDLFALAFDSNAFEWNQMHIKFESNETVLLLLHNVSFF